MHSRASRVSAVWRIKDVRVFETYDSSWPVQDGRAEFIRSYTECARRQLLWNSHLWLPRLSSNTFKFLLTVGDKD